MEFIAVLWTSRSPPLLLHKTAVAVRKAQAQGEVARFWRQPQIEHLIRFGPGLARQVDGGDGSCGHTNTSGPTTVKAHRAHDSAPIV